MKRTFFLLTIFLLNGILYSNPITSEPSFPTKNDSIIIYFDATKGDRGLMGFAGDVYAHTGVLTAESANSGDWKYVIAKWNENIAAAKLTRLSTDHYKLLWNSKEKRLYSIRLVCGLFNRYEFKKSGCC